MLNTLKPTICYFLSKNRTTQKFNTKKYQDILISIDYFLQNCALKNSVKLSELQLIAYDNNNDSYSMNLINSLINRYGITEIAPVAYDYLNWISLYGNKYTWKFTEDKLNDLINFLSSNSPLKKQDFDSLEIFFVYDFKLFNQNNVWWNSSLLVWLSRTNRCSPHLNFPFNTPDKKFWDYIDSITPFLPFTLDEKSLRLQHLNNLWEISSYKKIQR